MIFCGPQEVDGSDAPAVHSSGTAGSARAKKGATGPRKATPQRKQNNRKAQQRYREKRKMQAVEREEQVWPNCSFVDED